MSILEINNLRFAYTDNELFNDLNLRIFDGEHVGIVGLNGAGKTTFMNLLSGKLTPDMGSIVWDHTKKITYLDQHLVVDDKQTIYDYLYDVYANLFKREAEMQRLYESLAFIDASQYDKILNKAYNIQEELDSQEFYAIKSKINNVINGLGIIIEEDCLLNELSGGQRAKVFLGKMLLEEKDVLLLDEPTNFLDVQHIEWLSKFLVNYPNSFLVISHNADFLDSCCNIIVSIENKKMTKYKGNYTNYLQMRTMNMETYQKEYSKQQKEIKRTEEYIAKNIVRASTTKQAQSRRKQLEKMVVLDKPQNEKKIHFQFPFTKSFNLKAIQTKNLTIGYTSPILENISLDIAFGEKYMIIGKNGIGKTTLLKTLLGQVPPLAGNFKMSTYNDVAYFCQEINIPDITAIEYIRTFYPKMDNKSIRDLLAQYAIIGDLVIKSMKELSGGEQTKCRFALLSLESSNLLILDEPTNHLDKNAKEALYQALSAYPGTIIVVSHEKELYKKLNMKEIRF